MPAQAGHEVLGVLRRWLLLAVGGALTGSALFLLSPVEHGRVVSPDGRYTAVVSLSRYQRLMPSMPGQGSDKPGQIEILAADGRSMGSMPLPMIQFARELRWRPGGASIKLIGEWDFGQGRVAYWNEDQTALIEQQAD